APPGAAFTASSSVHDHPLPSLRGHSAPGILRSITAGSNRLSPLGSRMPPKSEGQPRHMTLTGYIRSAPKPSAQDNRLARTSPYTSPFAPPNLTLTSSLLPITHANFGDVPSRCFSRYEQTTVAPNPNAPGCWGPAFRSMARTFV